MQPQRKNHCRTLKLIPTQIPIKLNREKLTSNIGYTNHLPNTTTRLIHAESRARSLEEKIDQLYRERKKDHDFAWQSIIRRNQQSAENLRIEASKITVDNWRFFAKDR